MRIKMKKQDEEKTKQTTDSENRKDESVEANVKETTNPSRDPKVKEGAEGEEAAPKSPEKEAPSEETSEGASEAEESSKKETGETESVSEGEEELMMRFLRLQADFQNFRKRAEKEKADTVRYANERLVIQLLDIKDNLERALASEKEQDSFFDGIQMIHDQLNRVLECNGLEVIESDGEVFDPNRHNAVLMEESDTVEADHVIETLQKGYLLNGKLIRPAMVKVAK